MKNSEEQMQQITNKLQHVTEKQYQNQRALAVHEQTEQDFLK
ncbi:hypothetical protein ACW2QC_04610 [Virgibacillus sp. FSP13]